MAARKKTRSRREAKPAPAHAGRSIPLRSHAEQGLDSYFTSLNGHAPGHLYELVMREVEEPLFRAVLDYADGKQGRAADILGNQPRHAAQETQESALARAQYPHQGVV